MQRLRSVGRRRVSIRLQDLASARTPAGIQVLAMNSLRSAWTPVLAGLPESQMKAEGPRSSAQPPLTRPEL